MNRSRLCLSGLIFFFAICFINAQGPPRYFIFRQEEVVLVASDCHSLEFNVLVKRTGFKSDDRTLAFNEQYVNKYVIYYKAIGSTTWIKFLDSQILDFQQHIKILGLEKNTEYNLRIVGCYDGQPSLLNAVTVDDRITKHGSYKTVCEASLFLKNPRVDRQDDRVLLQWDIDNHASLTDFVYLIRWTNHSKACPANIKSIQHYEYVKSTAFSVEILTESYVKYNMSIAIGRDKKILQELFFPIFETDVKDTNINAEEKPSIRTLKSDASSIYVIFDNKDCDKIRGPLFLNFEASAASNEILACCNGAKLKSISKIQYPTRNDTLVIENLSPFCRYDVNIFMSRFGNDWSKKVNVSSFSIPTAGTGSASRQELPTLQAHADGTTIIITIQQPNYCMEGPIVLMYAIFHEDSESKCQSDAIEGKFHTYKINNRNQNLDPITIRNLQRNCNYTVRVKASRVEDENNYRLEYPAMSFVIEESAVIAGKIEDLRVTSQGPDLISLRWLPPRPSTGRLSEYRVCVVDKGYSTIAPKNCSLWPEYHCYDKILKTQEMASYTFRIFAIKENKKKDIQEDINEATKLKLYGQEIAESWEKEPDPPYGVNFNWNNGLIVFWKHPNSTNGLVKYFTIKIDLQYDSIVSNTITKIYDVPDRSRYLFQYFMNIDTKQWCRENYKLKKLELSIQTNLIKHQSKWGKSDTIFPPQPIEYQGDIRFINGGLKIPRLQSDCFLLFYNVYKASIYQKNEARIELHKITDHLKRNISYSSSINEKIYGGNRYNGDFTISRDLLNLTADASYILISMVVVNELNGLRTVNFKTVPIWIPKINNEAGYLGPVLFALLILPILCYFIYRYRRQIIFKTRRLSEDVATYFATGETDHTLLTGEPAVYKSYKDLYDWAVEDPQPSNHSKMINVENLRDYIKSAIESQELLRQHQMIAKTNNSQKSDYGNLPQNKEKNRYNTIIAYDHTRVRLLNSSHDSDYINANYIDGYKFSKAYIATQGPKPNTVDDFWTMIWENRVEYIVMLCTLFDGNKKNCEQYWPDEGLMEFNELTVEFITNKILPTFEERKFRVGLNGKTRLITQIHFTSWPPVGQALFPQTLMPLLQKLLTLPYRDKSPILVHCSAGVGRTGTIILCDICLRMAAAENCVDILSTFRRLRNQRPNMVDNIEQYKLAHLAILTSLTASSFSINNNEYFKTTVDNTFKAHQIQAQMAYIRDSEWQDDAMKTVAAGVQRHIPIVAEKNRFPDILPDELSQVFLQQLPNRDSTSCYINAVHVNSLYIPNRYIVTQQPLSTSVGDFWRLVFEQQCTVIVNLNPVDENNKTSVAFWPKEGIIAIDENLHIQLVESRHDKEISLHTLRGIYKPNEFENSRLKVQILQFNGWPGGDVIPENLEDFVSFVVEFFSIVGNDVRPLIVTCYDGATSSGFFVALAILIEQIKTEKHFDLCQIVRTIRICRKQFVNNEIQFKMLYRAATMYVNQFGLYEETFPQKLNK